MRQLPVPLTCHFNPIHHLKRSSSSDRAYQLIVTPDEPALGEFEKTGHVQTSIQYDQILKGEGGYR